MADGSERAKFSLADGRIEIEGSEAFVAGQLAKLEPLLVKMFEQGPPPPATPTVPSNSAPHPTGKTPIGSFDDYLNVFALADGKVQILKSIPGSGKAGKSMNAALLLAFANELNGVKPTSVDDVKSTCSSHACLDTGNFAKIFKGANGKESFTVSGAGPSQQISLTHPGKTKAKALADSLNK